MRFEKILDEALNMLQRRGRVTYRTFQLEFELDDDRLEALKDALLFAHCEITDKDCRGLVWTGQVHTPTQDSQPETDGEILDQAIVMLQRRGCITYRALQAQFQIDDSLLDILKEELLYSQPQISDDGRGLVWTGDPAAPEVNDKHWGESEGRFQASLQAVMMMLQRDRRVTYRTLKYVLRIDDALLAAIRKELRLRRLAVDEEDEVLVWTGDTLPSVQAGEIAPSPPNMADTATISLAPPAPQPRVTATDTTTNGPPTPSEEASLAPLSDEPFTAPQPVHSAPEAERRQLTVMFCDLSDSTKLSQQLDPEDLREVIRAYQQTSAEVIQRFDGYIAQHLGDGLLVYFGWPKAHEDDAQRALHAGLGIVEAMTTNLNPRLEHERGVKLAVRLGVHTGPVVVGEMGSNGRQENLATGETVNIAARLEGLAHPNTVVISNVTARLVQETFRLENMGPYELKGVADPMQVFQVLNPTEVQRDEDDRLPDGDVFLVGRDEEAGLLLRRWEQAKEGLGQVVLMSGEAGIGKSSLTAAMRTRVAQEGVTRLTFRCSPYHTNSALYPVVAHLEQLLGFDRDDNSDAKLDKLEQALKTTHLPIEESVPLLATLLSVPLEDRYPALTLLPQQQRQQTLDTLVGWLMEEAERQPVLAVWEDLHWADPSTLEMLELALEQTPTVSMLNVLTFRPEFTPPWPTRSHMTPITLNRLERPQVEAFITHLAWAKGLPGEVVEHIVTKTDGVPLYVEELTKMLMASDVLQEETDQYVLTGPLTAVAIPDTLQDSLMARLDQVNQAKEVAQLGAVLGREFDYEMLQAISSQDGETLQTGLVQLIDAELVYQRGRPPRAHYLFKHALIRDAAYASLLRNTRQQVHKQIAQTLEERFPEIVDIQPELLAHHYTEGGDNENAAGYWQKAGELAFERSANMETIEHYNKALEVLRTLPETTERTEQELVALLGLGASLMVRHGYGSTEAEHVYVQARLLCQKVENSPHLFSALWGYSRICLQRAECQEAREVGEQLLVLAEHMQESDRLMEAHFALGAPLLWMGEFKASRHHMEEGRRLYDRRRHQSLVLRSGHDPEIGCLTFEARALWFLGYPDQALTCIREALSRAQVLSHPFSLARALLFSVWLHQHRREVQCVQEQVEELLSLARAHDFAQWVACGMVLWGWALTMQGQEGGIAQIREGLSAQIIIGSELQYSYWLSLLAEAYAKLNRAEEGMSVLNEDPLLVDKTGVRIQEAELYRLKGQLFLQQSPENAREAVTCFHQAISIAQAQEAKSWELRAATSLARLWQSQDKNRDAYDLLAPVYNWFTEGFDTADLKDAKALLTELGV